MKTIKQIIKEKGLKKRPKIKMKIIVKKDKRGNEIYYKHSNNYEFWSKFDKNNKLIYSKNSEGYEKWIEYDNNGNIKDVLVKYPNNVWQLNHKEMVETK